MQVRDCAALVTGGAARTGRVIARRLAAEGALVVVADVDRTRGAETVRMIEAHEGRAWFVEADVTSPPSVLNMIGFAERELGGLQVLVNNAGGGGHAEPHFPSAQPDQWRATIELNLGGAMLATQLALEPMRRAGGGVVVNIASTAGIGFGPYASPEYAAAKAGLVRFTTSLAGLRERTGVRVNCIVPDWIATDRAEAELARMTPEAQAAAPARRAPEEIADAVLDFVRDEDRSGRALVMWPGEPGRLVDPAFRL